MIYLQYENFVFNLVFLIWCFNSYSQNITQQERTVYSTFSLYEQDSALKMVCRVAKRKIEEVYYLNVKNKSDSVVAIWGIKFEDKVWVKNRRKNKYYELKKDSVGVYYDLYNSERNSMGTGGPGGIIVYRFKNKNGISTELIGNTVIRYRMDSESGKFFPFDYPLLPKTKMVYYFSKYSGFL